MDKIGKTDKKRLTKTCFGQ